MAKAAAVPQSRFQRTWKPVDFKSLQTTSARYSGGTGAVTSEFTSVNWYNRLMRSSGKRQQSLRRFDMMDGTVDISRALDIMAEDISSTNIETTDTFLCEYPEEAKVQAGVLKAVLKAKDLWRERTEFDTKFFDYIREMLKYGAVFFLINKDYSLTKLIAQRMVGYILDNQNDNKVTAYLYDEGMQFINDAGDRVETGQRRERQRQIPVSDLLILKLGDGPYGKSVLDNVYRTWRHIQLIEDAVIIYRIVRAPERRIFYIDTGRLAAHKAEAYVEKVRKKIRQKQIQREDVIETEYNPTSIQEDYFIAQTSDGRSSKVQTLEGGQNMDQIKDLIYFNKKLALGLRIPMSYMISALDDNAQQATYNDGRVGTAYMEELRYAGYILRIQTKIAKPLFRHFKLYTNSIDLNLPDSLIFKIAEPQSFALYRENELYTVLLNTANSATGLGFISKKKILEKFIHFDKNDLADNEIKMLQQKGITQDVIGTLTQAQIDSIVYGGESIENVTGQTVGLKPPKAPIRFMPPSPPEIKSDEDVEDNDTPQTNMKAAKDKSGKNKLVK